MTKENNDKKLATAAQDPNRRAAIGLGLAAAIAVLAKLGTSAASAQSSTPGKKLPAKKTGTTKSDQAKKKTGTTKSDQLRKTKKKNELPSRTGFPNTKSP
jgi:hypothetical protein